MTAPNRPWRLQDARAAALCAVLASVSLVYGLVHWGRVGEDGPAHWFGDFFALWSYGVIAAQQGAASLYDSAGLHAAQMALGLPGAEQLPFPYPPPAILLFWPLGWLPLTAAYALWCAAGLGLLAWTVGDGWRGRLAALAILLASPAGTSCLVTGQSGFVLAAMLAGGWRLRPARPLLAGVLFGMATYKPQFGLLVPLALVAQRDWRCVAAAGGTAAALAGGTAALWGAAIWRDWLAAMPGYNALFEAEARWALMPTAAANLRELGASPGAAYFAQAMLAAAVAAWVWRLARRDHPGLPAAVLAGTFLVTPHAFLYDLPVAMAAVLLHGAQRWRAARGFSTGEVLAMAAVTLTPVFMAVRGVDLPVSTPAIALFMAVACGGWRASRSPAPRYAAAGTPAS